MDTAYKVCYIAVVGTLKMVQFSVLFSKDADDKLPRQPNTTAVTNKKMKCVKLEVIPKSNIVYPRRKTGCKSCNDLDPIPETESIEPFRNTRRSYLPCDLISNKNAPRGFSRFSEPIPASCNWSRD